MDVNERIAQWEKMTREVPDDMSWFSLGTAYRDANRFEDAVVALAKAIELNSGMSRAHQLRGGILIQLGREEEAEAVLTEGYRVAAQRGDVMPQKAMGSLLEKIGRPLPDVAEPEAETTAVADGEIIDRRSGQPGARLPDPPMRGPVGRYVYDHYTQDTWREWIGQGTKVINELKLDFSNIEHQKVYDSHMMEWLGISEDDVSEFAARAEST